MLINKTFLQKAAWLFCLMLTTLMFSTKGYAQQGRTVADFDKGWHFHLGDVKAGESVGLTVANWRMLNLPNDWSIEGTFSKDNPATHEGGALPAALAGIVKALPFRPIKKTSWCI